MLHPCPWVNTSQSSWFSDSWASQNFLYTTRKLSTCLCHLVITHWTIFLLPGLVLLILADKGWVANSKRKRKDPCQLKRCYQEDYPEDWHIWTRTWPETLSRAPSYSAGVPSFRPSCVTHMSFVFSKVNHSYFYFISYCILIQLFFFHFEKSSLFLGNTTWNHELDELLVFF